MPATDDKEQERSSIFIDGARVHGGITIVVGPITGEQSIAGMLTIVLNVPTDVRIANTVVVPVAS